MPLQKITLKPGVNRENTRYTNEGGYYESNLVRFRQGTPEKIGGWQQISPNTYTGLCRSLWNWTTLAEANLIGVGSEVKFYISQQTDNKTDAYYDVTPIISSHALASGPLSVTIGSSIVTITDNTYHPYSGDYVIFSGMTLFHGITLNGQYKIVSTPSNTTYTVDSGTTATTGTGTYTGGGGANSFAAYLLNVGTTTSNTTTAWGDGNWNDGTWGGIVTTAIPTTTKLWTQYNFGENLLFGPKKGAMYLWNAVTSPTLSAPTTVTISNGASTAPAVVTLTSNTTTPIPDGTAIMFETTATAPTVAALPLPLAPYTVYYVRYLTSTTFNLSVGSEVIYPFASCSGTTLTVYSVTGTLAVGMSIYYYTGTGDNQLSLGTITAFGTGTGGAGTYTVSGGGSISSTTMGAVTVIITSSAGSGTQTISIRAIPVSSLTGASNVPLSQNTLLVSDASRFTFAFGTNEYLSTTYDPMVIRWSDQESLTNWTPSATNQAGSIRLSHGSNIRAVLQSRQEILVFTDAALYSLQYLGAPYVWSSQILSDNISIVSINAAAYTNGSAYWMGQDKFYKYDGRVQTLRCDLRQFIYDDIDRTQFSQIFASTNEGFNEVWWFYCTENAPKDNGVPRIDRYVVYNYVEDVWYYGSMQRTAWLDSSLRDYPIAATYSNNLVYHEYGVDDGTTLPAVAINSSITTSQFDIGDGHNFAFVWRLLPDLTFRGSTDGSQPSLTIQLQPLQNSGSSYNDPVSIGGTSANGTQTVNTAKDGVSPLYVYPQDPDIFTGQLNIRVRGRQMSMRIACNVKGTQWQLGAPRIDIRPDGRRGG
jgi:hypothetical protein